MDLYRAERWFLVMSLLGFCLAGLICNCDNSIAAEGKSADAKWIALFNGKDLNGWKRIGRAKWTVEDGILVGVQGEGGAAGDLQTAEEYDNFELTVTFKVEWPANSGVWFRWTPRRGGYQMDILDLKEYGCTVGSIYSPGRMFIAKNLDESTVKFNDWNTAKILADGAHIVVSLNAKKVADINDDKHARGSIGFQVHPGAKYSKMKIMIKEAKLRKIKKK